MATGSGNEFTFRPTEPETGAHLGEDGHDAHGQRLGPAAKARAARSWEGLSTQLPPPRRSTSPWRHRHIFTFDASNAGSASLNIVLGEGRRRNAGNPRRTERRAIPSK